MHQDPKSERRVASFFNDLAELSTGEQSHINFA
jgi:hypothetical protein